MKKEKCEECGQTEKDIKANGYDFKIEKCRHCKQYFCEACLINGDSCPDCSNIVPL